MIVREFALLSLLLSPLAAGAADFPVVTGLSFTYASPNGLCAVDVDRSARERLLAGQFEQALGSALRPSVLMTECGFLATLRDGGAVDALPSRGTAILLPLHDGEPQQTPVSRSEFLETAPAKIKEELLPRLQGAGLDIVGIHEEPEAFYVVFRAGSPGLGIVAITLLQGYQVGTLSISLGDGTTEEDFLAEARAFMLDLIERNDPEGASRSPYRWLGIDWDRWAPYLPIAGAIGFVYWWRGRRMRARHRVE